MASRWYWLALLLTADLYSTEVHAQNPAKYALLVAVTKYDRTEIKSLAYSEDDAKALGELLKSGGYEVDYLLGKQASQKAIRDKLDALKNKGTVKGIVLVGLFGNGVEIPIRKAKNEPKVDDQGHEVTEACFCPYDTTMRQTLDQQGNPALSRNGCLLHEPDPDTVIKLTDLMATLKAAKADHRVVLADCCREIPEEGRGRSFGASFQAADLPPNTAVLFGSSAREKVFEHREWGHGAFTKCLLEELPRLSSDGETTTSELSDRLKVSVPELIASYSPRDRQTPMPFSTNEIDLQLSKSLTMPESKPTPTPTPTGEPGSEIAKANPGRFNGKMPGEKKELVPGINFRWCRPGNFTMGTTGAQNDEVPKQVKISQGFWMGETEVTQRQWKSLMGTAPFEGKQYVQNDDLCPAVYVNHLDATEFCEKLTEQETSAGRLPAGWKYALPTEAQWEYACRAGTKTKFSFGDEDSRLGDYAWFVFNAWNGGEKFLHRTGMKKANQWGLRDMHGNVLEWCADWYDANLPGGTDPAVLTNGTKRIVRGGDWNAGIPACRSAARNKFDPVAVLGVFVGFRVAAVPTGKVSADAKSESESMPSAGSKSDTKPPTRADFVGKTSGDGKELVPGINFRWCQPGGFVIGVPEAPRPVKLTQGFWMGETEVTQGQYKTLMDTAPWEGKAGVKEDDQCPAAYVTHDEATAFCEKLTEQERSAGRLPTGWKYALPTEAQWEYACRAGTKTKYSFGDDDNQLSEYGWWGGQVGNGNAKSEPYAHPVGMKKANPWGLKDMHGNVWEWCADWYVTPPPGGTNPAVLSNGSERVFRGGSWHIEANISRSGFRNHYLPSNSGSYLGFRVACVQSSKSN